MSTVASPINATPVGHLGVRVDITERPAISVNGWFGVLALAVCVGGIILAIKEGAALSPLLGVAVPVMAPGAIEAIAQSYGATVIRARSDRRSLMALAESRGRELAFVGGANHEVVFPELHPAFDAL